MAPPWNLEGSSHPEEEEKLINISLGYKVLPLYMGPTESCINVTRQTGFRPASKRGLSDTAWIIHYSFFVHEHVYTTKTLVKELGKEQ